MEETENASNKYKQKCMGIVLKRRDNAPIVKIACGGIVREILNNHSKEGAFKFIEETLANMLNNKFPIAKYIMSKTLKAVYKNRNSIAHAVLADRMTSRDPGNAPKSNDRLPYVFIVSPNAKLQGDRIEHPEYIIQHNLKIDFLYYITNQISKPCRQFLDLLDADKAKQIFTYFINLELNKRKGVLPITSYFNNTTTNESITPNMSGSIYDTPVVSVCPANVKPLSIYKTNSSGNNLAKPKPKPKPKTQFKTVSTSIPETVSTSIPETVSTPVSNVTDEIPSMILTKNPNKTIN
jgi:hypothetical protein